MDIMNLDTKKMKPSDNTDYLKRKVEKLCQNMMKVAEEAIIDDPHLEKVTIMNLAPRFDTKDVDPVQLKTKLATFANGYFLELWFDSSMKDKIIIGSHTLECSADVKKQRILMKGQTNMMEYICMGELGRKLTLRVS